MPMTPRRRKGLGAALPATLRESSRFHNQDPRERLIDVSAGLTVGRARFTFFKCLGLCDACPDAPTCADLLTTRGQASHNPKHKETVGVAT